MPLLAGCAYPAGQDTVAIALPEGDGRFAGVAAVLTERLTDAGYGVELRVADGGVPAQVMQVRELLGTSPAALVVWPVDPEALTPVLDAAPAELEVLTLGTLVRDTAAVDDWVAFDAGAAGRLQATALLQGLGLVDDAGAPIPDAPPGPFRIELVAGSSDDPATKPALAAALDTLEPFLDAGALVVGSGETKLSEVATLRGNAETAASRLTRILRESYPDGLPDAVLATSDELARGVASALLDAGAVAGEGFPVVTGRGAQLRSLAALVDGRQYATLLEDPRELAAVAADAVVAALEAASATPGASPTAAAPGDASSGDRPTVDNGAARVRATLVPPVTVRADDIERVVIGSGYWSRDEVAEALAE